MLSVAVDEEGYAVGEYGGGVEVSVGFDCEAVAGTGTGAAACVGVSAGDVLGDGETGAAACV